MAVGHDPVLVTQTRDAAAIGGTAVDGDEFSDGVVVTNLKGRCFAGKFLVLRFLTDGGKLKDSIVGTQTRAACNDYVRANPAAAAQLDFRTNDAVGAHFDVFGELGGRLDDGGGMDHAAAGFVLAAHISSALATVLSPMRVIAS